MYITQLIVEIIVPYLKESVSLLAGKAGLFHELPQKRRHTVSMKEGMRPLLSRMPSIRIRTQDQLKKRKNPPLQSCLLFFSISSSKCLLIIETFYWTEDIPSQQILLIIEKIHHLADRGLIAGLDLHQANDIQCILSYQCEIVSGASGR